MIGAAFPPGAFVRIVALSNQVQVWPFIQKTRDHQSIVAFYVTAGDMVSVIADPFDASNREMVDMNGNRKIAILSPKHVQVGWIWSDYLKLIE